MVISQNMVVELAKEADASATWTEVPVDAAPLMKSGMEGLRKGEFNMSNLLNVLTAVAFSGQYQMAFKETDNGALGLGSMSLDQLSTIIAQRNRGHRL